MAGLSYRKVVGILIFLYAAAAVNSETEVEIAQDDTKQITRNEKDQCIKKFVKWCDSKQYPQEGANDVSLMSISYHDGTNYYRVFCSSDSDGTNCSRNGSPWFTCTPDHVLTYKGEVLTKTTTDVDDDICNTQQRVFNELLMNNMPSDNSTFSVFEKELKSFFSEIQNMHQQIYELHKRLGDISFMGDDFLGGFDGFPFEDDEDSENENPTEKNDTNQIEKE